MAASRYVRTATEFADSVATKPMFLRRIQYSTIADTVNDCIRLVAYTDVVPDETLRYCILR